MRPGSAETADSLRHHTLGLSCWHLTKHNPTVAVLDVLSTGIEYLPLLNVFEASKAQITLPVRMVSTYTLQ